MIFVSSMTMADNHFVHFMDVALDLIGPLSLFAPQADTSNIARQHAEASINSTKIRSIIDALIGQTLAFINVASKDDRIPLTAMCQKVLRDCIAFEAACSLELKNPDEQDRRLRASTLENALYQLDKWMNDSLLRLVFDVFVEMTLDPIQKLRELRENESSQDIINNQIEKIDELFEKIVQIGNFAISFAWNYKLKSKLRSSLASLESLDSFLIPSVLSKSKVHSELLQSHWNEEISTLTISIQNIIDTHAFCGSMIDILSTAIRTLSQSFNKDLVSNVLLHCDVLEEHCRINFDELELGVESSRRLHFDDCVLMLKESRAALELCQENENLRILKRLKILLCVLKKFHATLKPDNGRKPENDKILTLGEVSMPSDKLVVKTEDVKSDSMKVLNNETDSETFFKSVGIVPSPMKTILYESKREKVDLRSSSQKIDVNGLSKCKRPRNAPSPIASKKIKKRSSLRIELFKRSKENETKKLWDSFNNDTLGLHITDILDQITDLSSTLSTTSNI